MAAISNSETITGKVNGNQAQFIVDTSVEVTVVHSNLVSKKHLRPNTIEIVGAIGVPVTTRVVEVEFDILGKHFLKTVAVVSSECCVTECFT